MSGSNPQGQFSRIKINKLTPVATYIESGTYPLASFVKVQDYFSEVTICILRNLGAQKALVDLGQRGIIIRKIRAHSSKPVGIRLMRHFGFTETEAAVKGLRDFEIDVESSGIPMVGHEVQRSSSRVSEPRRACR